MENKALGLNANMALGLVLYFPYSTGGNDLTLTYIYRIQGFFHATKFSRIILDP